MLHRLTDRDILTLIWLLDVIRILTVSSSHLEIFCRPRLPGRLVQPRGRRLCWPWGATSGSRSSSWRGRGESRRGGRSRWWGGRRRTVSGGGPGSLAGRGWGWREEAQWARAPGPGPASAPPAGSRGDPAGQPPSSPGAATLLDGFETKPRKFNFHEIFFIVLILLFPNWTFGNYRPVLMDNLKLISWISLTQISKLYFDIGDRNYQSWVGGSTVRNTRGRERRERERERERLPSG